MANFRSQKNKYFTLIALFLFLPVVASFAATSNFWVKAQTETGTAVSGAKVYLWDKNTSYPSLVYAQGMTGTDGVASLTISNIVMTTNSTSNPSPNIGIFVVPPTTTTLAWNIDELLFYNFLNQNDASIANGNEGSMDTPKPVTLPEGVKVKFQPTVDEQAGLKSGAEVRLGMVPENFARLHSITPSAISSTTASFDFYWQKNTSVEFRIYGDGNLGDTSSPDYYDYVGKYAEVKEAELVVPFNHVKRPKGIFSLTLVDGSDAVQASKTATLKWNQGWYNGFTNMVSVIGSKTIYLPLGTYNFLIEPSATDEALTVRAGINVGQTMHEERVNLSGGAVITTEIQLGEAPISGDESAVNGCTLIVERQVTIAGYKQWVTYQNRYLSSLSSSAATFSMQRKFEPGVYRIRVTNYGQSGVIDQSDANELKSFRFGEGIIFSVADETAITTPKIILPQTPAFQANVKDVSGSALYGNLMVGVIPANSNGTGYTLYSGSGYTYSGTRLFVPFLSPGAKVVVRTDKAPVGAVPQIVKVFEPKPLTATYTTVLPEDLIFDEANFVTLIGNVIYKGQNFEGSGRVKFEPIIPGTELIAKRVFGAGDATIVKELLSDGGYAFKVEKGQRVRFEVVESLPSGAPGFGLNGFVPTIKVEAIATDAVDFVYNLPVSEGGKFTAQIQNNGQGLDASATVGITVTPLIDSAWSDYGQVITRSGIVGSGTFTVSGLNSGPYKINFNLDGINPNEPNFSYASQSMPLISREIFVDAAVPSNETLTFNFDSSMIGLFTGTVKNELGEPIEGLKIVIGKKQEEFDDPYADYFQDMAVMANTSEPIFFCTTNADGKIVSNGREDVPLEGGEYVALAVGIASESVDYSYGFMGYAYDYGAYGDKLSDIRILPGDLTYVEYTLERKFKIDGTVKEYNKNLTSGDFEYLNVPSAGITVLNEEGQPVGYGANVYDGDFQFYHTYFAPGNYNMIISFVDYSTVGYGKYYLRPFEITDQNLVKDIQLNPSELQSYMIKAKDSSGEPLADATFGLVVLTDPALGFDGPHIAVSSHEAPRTDSQGNLVLQLPTLPSDMGDAKYALVPQSYEELLPIIGNDGSAINGTRLRTYEPMQSFILLDSTATATIEAVWEKPAEVEVKLTNALPEDASRYIGMLLPKEMFDNGIAALAGTQTPYGHMDYMSVKPVETPLKPELAPFMDNKFSFASVRHGEEYVFVVYKAFEPVEPYSLLYWRSGNGFYWKSSFRHVSEPFMVEMDEDSIQLEETLMPMAPLSVSVYAEDSEEPLVDAADYFDIELTSDPEQTAGNPAWPLIMPPTNVALLASSGASIGSSTYFPIMVPANYGLRIGFNPSDFGFNQYLAKIDENVKVPVDGKDHEMILKKLNRVYGDFTYNDGTGTEPTEGLIYVWPDGASPDNDATLKEVKADYGYFEAYLSPGYYVGYAIPVMGAPSFVQATILPGEDLEAPIEVEDGVGVSGTIEDADGKPIYNAAVAVLRKVASKSTLLDGQMFIPYPAALGEEIVKCGPAGDFYFEAESDVDYYLQAIVPGEFKAPAPKRLALGNTATETKIIVSKGAAMYGSSNVPAFIEAKPMAKNMLDEQFSVSSLIQSEAMFKGDNGRYAFKLVGLKPGVPYTLTVWPTDPTKAIKTYEGIIVANYSTAETALQVEVGVGYKIYGQLRDESGAALAIKDVPVNLAMTLAMETLPTVNPNSQIKVMQDITSDDPANFSLQNVNYQGMWAKTNEKGEFTFNKVPGFLVAFLKTDKGFSLNNVDYGRTRTESFVASYTNNIMKIDLTVPRGGKIVGKLIDENGSPIKKAEIEVGFGETWTIASVAETGKFEISGLAPAANYSINVQEAPGFVPVFRMGIAVEPGKTKDLGAIVVYKASEVTGEVENIQPIADRAFKYGAEEGTSLSMVALDGLSSITDQELLSGSFMKYVNGVNDLFWNPDDEDLSANVPFALPVKAGKTHFGIVLDTQTADGVRSMVTWSWRPGVSVPTQSQLNNGEFNLTEPFKSPSEFGLIEGSLKHAVITDAKFSVDDAVIALYPVVSSGTEFVLTPVPFPTAFTSPVDGKWFLDNVPYGKYRIKVITKKFGVQFFNDIVEIGANPVSKALELGTSIKRVYGTVTAGTKAVANAKVKLVLENILTSTNASGTYEFYLPVGAHIIPEIEVIKSGFQAVRKVRFDGIASTGFDLVADTSLGVITLSGDVGTFEATVKSSTTSKPIIGAEVALVYPEVINQGVVDEYNESLEYTVWTVAESQVTNETGNVRFASVPTGKPVKFRTRAFYHEPQVIEVTVDATKRFASQTVTLGAALPRVFYTGFVTPVDGDDSKVNFDAIFDFDQPVEKTKLDLLVASDSYISAATPVSPIGNKFLTMKFNGNVASRTPLIASVTYNAAEIGRFDLSPDQLFAKEFAVDPMSDSGFTGRQTDASGTALPVGLSVPKGYLDPSIKSFNIKVEQPKGEPVIEGASGAGFSGPAFEFTFNGGSNSGAGAKQTGLFEITIKYTEGQQLEPRYYDETRKQWSKVGINKDSIKWDSPSKGYVTFKVSHLTKFAVLKNVSTSASGLLCDFDANGTIADADLMFLLAANQVKGLAKLGIGTYDVATVKTAAQNLYSSGNFTNAVLPGETTDDVNGDGKVGDEDLMILLSYIQKKGLADLGIGTADATSVAANAKTLLPTFSGTVTKLPGEKVNR